MILSKPLSQCVVLLVALAVVAGAADADPAPDNDDARQALINEALGLQASRVITIEPPARSNAPSRVTPLSRTTQIASGPQPFSFTLPIDRRVDTIDLWPFSNRSPQHYRLLVQRADGSLITAAPGPVRTLRGAVRNQPGSAVAASLLQDGLYARIRLADQREFWIEPLNGRVPGAGPADHVLYRTDDVLWTGYSCANEARAAAQRLDPPPASAGGCGGGVCIAELACDADVEYFNDYGSVSAVEARINSVINTVNLQYEAQVDITHEITTIVVRTANPDPYTSTDAETRLCEFITEWTNNQTGIQRDVAHLFTGAELDSSTIGIAADIGGSGICVNSGACTGGPFGPLGSYSLAQSDFNGMFGCATDLSAHELGHLWGAFHCSCPSNTMNTPIACANSFSAGSISSIAAYRDTRACLSSGVGCTQDCQTGATLEGEPVCAMDYNDTFNGGCNASPAVWTSISPGESVCGESGTFLRDIPCTDDTPCTPVGETCNVGAGICNGGPFSSRDTDWWQFTLTEAREMNWCVTAEFPVLAGLVDDGGGTCSGAAFVAADNAFQCEQLCVTADLSAGTWTAFASPNTFDSVDCGETYNAQLTCDNVAGSPVSYGATVNQSIPDADPGNPLVHTINVPDSAIIGDLDVDLVINHTWVGDLVVDIEHAGTTARLIDRPGLPDVDPTFGCPSNNYDIVLDDGGPGGPIEDLCAGNNDTLPPSPPNYIPHDSLRAFDGMNSAGDWTITISDFASPDPGTLVSWAVIIDQEGNEPCAADLCAGVDCDDSIACTVDTCAGGVCFHDDLADPVITCPPDINVHADAGTCAAVLDPGQPGVTDNCDDPGDITVSAARDDGQPNLTDPYASADSPIAITWTAQDQAGNGAQCVQTITVSSSNEMVVDVELSPTVATPLTRCVTFDLADCGGGSTTVEQQLTFTNGLADDVPLLVPCGQYDCISARDSLHTLRKTDPGFGIVATQYVSAFTTAGSNALTGGNLNGDDYIDIFDFGIFAGQWNTDYGTGDTTCATASPHADISGNAMVFTDDFTFIQINFLQQADAACCTTTSAGDNAGHLAARGPVREISVAELQQRGMEDLTAGDLNNDGWLNEHDIAAFINGARPQPKQTREKRSSRTTGKERTGK